MSYEIFLKKGEEKRIVAGHSWVYANEVARIEGKDKNGALATVRAFDGRYIGKGYINHASKILVRIFLRGNEEESEDLLLSRIRRANDHRRALGYENCYRAVFAEADDLPALIVDKYGDYLCVQLLSLGVYLRKAQIVNALVRVFSPKGIYERSDVSVRKKEGLAEETGVLYGEVPERVEIEENGLRMLVSLQKGQKTGYFLDQKENRFAVRRYARGDVLDCFCNSGGFSLNAALSADCVTALDISEFAAAEFRMTSDDPFWAKLEAIEHGWKIAFSLYGGDPEAPDGGPVGNWMGIRPVHCREAVALFLNFTYMIDMEEHEEILRANEDRLYGNGGVNDKVTAETVLRQMRQPRTLYVGLVYPGNGVIGLGGGTAFGAYQQAWFHHYTNTYSCEIMFHELGHVMGYSHSSSFTYGPWAQELMNHFYVDHISEMPIDSPTYLNSSQNPHRYQ